MSSILLSSCIYCSSNNIWKYGFYNNLQVWKCKSCGRTFTKLSASKYSRHRFPKEIILFSVMLCRHGLSSYAISEVLRKRFKTKVSAWTVCKWARKFGNIKHILKHINAKFGKIWHMDEMFIKAKGKMHYLYAVIDDKSNAIALHVSDKRDKQSAILCLRKAKYIAGKPEIIVTDGWQAYPNIIRKVFGWSRKNNVKHVVAHFRKELVLHKGKWYALSNNRIEGWNSWFRRVYRGMRGFKSIVSFQRFLDIFWVLWNLKSSAWEFLEGL